MAVPQDDDVWNGVRAIGLKHHERNSHGVYAGIDVSLKESSVCVVDATGKLVREAKVGSEPECLVEFFDRLDFPVERIGLEAGPLSQWLHAALVAAGHEVVLLETRHVKAALSAMTVKTDRKDARGIAQLLRMGWCRPFHAKSSPAQDTRALLVGRSTQRVKLPRRRRPASYSAQFVTLNFILPM